MSTTVLSTGLLLLLLLICQLTTSHALLRFREYTTGGEVWLHRASPNVEFVQKNGTFMDGTTGRQTQLVSYFLLYGGENNNQALTDGQYATQPRHRGKQL